ncbi:unnamed protein product [Rangifer tarandus platyrhynchus]|uniref:Uncharacterized protein n=1 Tax=Rangifer tarandus platyrhynchus TaxID=3082113 RepID=A0AC59Z2W1_RANTA
MPPLCPQPRSQMHLGCTHTTVVNEPQLLQRFQGKSTSAGGKELQSGCQGQVHVLELSTEATAKPPALRRADASPRHQDTDPE